MLIQQCINCGSEYNNLQRVAMYSCTQKHKICNLCIQLLRSINEVCPTCHKQLLNNNIQAQGNINHREEGIIWDCRKGCCCILSTILPIFVILFLMFMYIVSHLKF